jgi:hypothetical protein
MHEPRNDRISLNRPKPCHLKETRLFALPCQLARRRPAERRIPGIHPLNVGTALALRRGADEELDEGVALVPAGVAARCAKSELVGT